MGRIFQIAEEVLQPYLDQALRSGGLLMHKVTQDLLSALKESNTTSSPKQSQPEASVTPSDPPNPQ
jgi:hypothetical protein